MDRIKKKCIFAPFFGKWKTDSSHKLIEFQQPTMNTHHLLPPLSGSLVRQHIPIALLLGILCLAPPVFASPSFQDLSVARYVPNIASPFSLPSEQTAARMEMRKSNSWRESWFGDVTEEEPHQQQAVNPSARTLFGSVWRDEVPFQQPMQEETDENDLPYAPYYYQHYTSPLTSVGAMSVAAMATTTTTTPKQKLSGRLLDSDFEYDPEDPGNKSEESPVGEAWSLLFLAAAYTLYTLRKKQHPTTENL